MPISRTCRISWKEFTITDQEITLLDKLSPIIWGEKFLIPLPTISPEERFRMKLTFKNYFFLFHTIDTLTGENIISGHPPNTPLTVFSLPHWWSDNWDPIQYAKDYDSSLSIVSQVAHIWKVVPVPALDNAYRDIENSDFVNGCGPSKDCYLTSNSAYNEKCLYGWFIFHSTHILDSNNIIECQNCSYSQHLKKCYNIHIGWNNLECRDSRYIFSCDGCQNLLGCVWLRNQKYQILNTACTPEEFESTLSKLRSDPIFRKHFEKNVQGIIRVAWFEPGVLTGSTDSVGDFCYNSRNAYECYNVNNCEDVLYITDSFQSYDSAHISLWWDTTRLSYNSIDVGLNISNVYFSTTCWEGSYYNLYCHKCNNCQYIFGCSWLRDKSYCIFNRQYSKEDWESTVKKIIWQMQKEWTWGEFLDPKYAPFAYNESLGNIFDPLTKNEAQHKWFHWSDREEITPEGIAKTIPWDRIPDTIDTIPDDVLNWAIRCRVTGKLYMIQRLELEFHRKYGIPLPQIHPIERIKMRFGWDTRTFDFDF